LLRFLRRSLDFRFGLRWYAVALLTPPLIGLSVIALHAAQGSAVPAFSALQGLNGNVAKFLMNTHDASGGAAGSSSVIQTLAGWAAHGALQAAVVLFAIALANGGLSEEAGWRGYALNRLLPGRNVLLTALVVGFFWGLWHTGPAFWSGVFQSNWRVFAIPLGYTLGTIPLTVMIAWVFINSGRSLVPGMLFHAAYNSTYFLLTQIWTPGRPVVSLTEWLTGTYLAAAIIVIAGRHTFFARVTSSSSDRPPD
jgi:membrane protease YdiL (CAAX protease family)